MNQSLNSLLRLASLVIFPLTCYLYVQEQSLICCSTAFNCAGVLNCVCGCVSVPLPAVILYRYKTWAASLNHL